MRSVDEMEAAALHVGYEWISLAEMSRELDVTGNGLTVQNALLEACLIHDRCLINFCSGDAGGRRHPDDIKPSDFLGLEWWPRDEQYDRELRGRLEVINKHLAHLTWTRVTDTTPVFWSVVFLAHEVSWGMEQFVRDVLAESAPGSVQLEAAMTRVRAVLPNLPKSGQTATPMAAPRPVHPSPWHLQHP